MGKTPYSWRVVPASYFLKPFPGAYLKGLDGPGRELREGEGLAAGVDQESFLYRLLQGNS